MKFLFFFILVCWVSLTNARQAKQLTKVQELKMPFVDGARYGGLAWNASLKLYYAVFLGNRDFPIFVFNEHGENISPADSLRAGGDIRGFWFNPHRKRLEANLYGDSGWIGWQLNERGMPQQKQLIFDEGNQPDMDCVGVYDESSDDVYFLYGSGVYSVDATTGAGSNDVTTIYIGYSSDVIKNNHQIVENFDNSYIDEGNYNTTNLILQKSGGLLGVLNIDTRSIEWYSRKTGILQSNLLLPPDIAALPDRFNFCYLNGLYWIYFSETHSWVAFK
jgi:hypothetical protein